MDKKIKARIVFVFACFILGFFVVFTKAFFVQVVNNQKLISYSKEQILRESEVYPYRGNIFDRNGSPLAINVKTYSIFTIPKNMENRDRTLRALAKIVPELILGDLKEKIYKRQRYTWLARKISLTDKQVEKIKDLKGVYIESVPKRFYPNHELLGQTLGMVGVDNAGLAGIEFLFDKELRGTPIKLKYLQDAKGRPIKFETKEKGGDAKDIYLSIDKEIQSMAEKTIRDAVLEHKAEKGGIGVIDAETGEVLAVANYPSFDPNDVENSQAEHRKLSFVSDPFEPGSTFKLLTVASALENKIARPDTNYYCEQGKMLVEDHYISEAESKKKYEWLSVSDIVKYSSNVGTTKMAFDLTYPKLQKTLKDFRIGEKTGVEIPGESRGIFVSKENVSPLTLSNISFGQGVATTGIQMLSAYAAIANGGNYIRPTILKGGNDNNKKIRILSEETAKDLQKMLVKAVNEGTGTNAIIPHFVIAGKTSTAQKHDKLGGYKGYIPGFIGFPLNVSQKFVIYAYIDNPEGEYYGNLVAAPVFKKVAEYMLYRNKEFNVAKENQLSKNEKSVRPFDEIKMVNSASRFISKDVMPNFIGLDKLSSQELLKSIEINAEHKGMGVVKDQFPPAGSNINKDTIVRLYYTPPKYE